MSWETKTGMPYKDLRRVFDDEDVQAVAMPLPNHWQALATIWACQAATDVYVEKPANNGMVQVGAQSRSRTNRKQPLVQSARLRCALHSHGSERGCGEP